MGRKKLEVVKKSHKSYRKRGRPKGSKNRATILLEAQNKLAEESKHIPPPLHPPRSFKHMGYCKFCGAGIGEVDIEGKKYKCPHCSKSGFRRDLKKKKDGEKYTDKKDYFERVTEATVLENLPLSDELDPKDIVVRE